MGLFIFIYIYIYNVAFVVLFYFILWKSFLGSFYLYRTWDGGKGSEKWEL